MINVGSVGQPRDGDNRACYVVFEDGLGEDGGDAEAERPTPPGAGSGPRHGTDSGDTEAERPAPVQAARILFRRLPYDFEATIKKIYSIPELEPFLGDRLRQGR
jgi:hypothetical protein